MAIVIKFLLFTFAALAKADTFRILLSNYDLAGLVFFFSYTTVKSVTDICLNYNIGKIEKWNS